MEQEPTRVFMEAIQTHLADGYFECIIPVPDQIKDKHMTTSNTEKMTFKPRPSIGWMWVILAALVPLGVALTVMLRFGFKGPVLPTILITAPMGIGFLLVAAFFPSMKYELDGSSLMLSYGPLLRYTIDIKQIKSIRRRDLEFTAVSSFRFPGLAIFSVPYPEIGPVKMCATAANHGILLIETDSTRYGITPSNEESFVAELRKRMEP
jgi:hypothetical protein